MKRRILNVLLLTALTVMVSSCKDDEKPSKAAFLTTQSWIMAKFEVGGVDVTHDLEYCDTDNLLTFNEDGTLIEDTGAIKCNDREVSSGGTWKFKTNETIITIHPDGEDALDWKIVEITVSSFKISRFDEDTDRDWVIAFIAK